MTWRCRLFGHEPRFVRRTLHIVCLRCIGYAWWMDE